MLWRMLARHIFLKYRPGISTCPKPTKLRSTRSANPTWPWHSHFWICQHRRIRAEVPEIQVCYTFPLTRCWPIGNNLFGPLIIPSSHQVTVHDPTQIYKGPNIDLKGYADLSGFIHDLKHLIRGDVPISGVEVI